MKILYLITKSNLGGAQRYVFDLATAAKAAGHDVVVSFGGNGPLALQLVNAGIRTVPLPSLLRDVNILNDFRSFLRLLELFAEEAPDIIHLNSSKIGVLGVLAGRLWNMWAWFCRLLRRKERSLRIIFTGHGWAFNEERTDGQRFAISALHWLTILLSHQTIAVSRKTREQISRLPFVWHKIVVIYNGVGPITTLARDEALFQIFGLKKEMLMEKQPLIVGTIAELHKNKGLNYAIEGIAQLKRQSSTPLLFVIIGDGEERTHLEALVTKLALDQTVYFIGIKENAATLLSAFDIFLLPSITEAFPYVILEAGTAGLPVIATAVGGIPEIIDDMESGILIQSKNSGEVTRAVHYLIENPERREALGSAIAARIHGRFNVATMAQETFALYKSLTPE